MKNFVVPFGQNCVEHFERADCLLRPLPKRSISGKEKPKRLVNNFSCDGWLVENRKTRLFQLESHAGLSGIITSAY
jgi:hypothetical protein